MAKSPKAEDIELEPDAWQRFERFVRGIAKAGPQHRKPSKDKDASQKPKQASKKRVRKD